MVAGGSDRRSLQFLRQQVRTAWTSVSAEERERGGQTWEAFGGRGLADSGGVEEKQNQGQLLGWGSEQLGEERG